MPAIWTEVVRSLKLSNVWVFVQLICRPAVQKPKQCLTWDMHVRANGVFYGYWTPKWNTAKENTINYGESRKILISWTVPGQTSAWRRVKVNSEVVTGSCFLSWMNLNETSMAIHSATRSPTLGCGTSRTSSSATLCPRVTSWTRARRRRSWSAASGPPSSPTRGPSARSSSSGWRGRRLGTCRLAHARNTNLARYITYRVYHTRHSKHW